MPMYNRGMFEFINQTTNWDTGDIRVLIPAAGYTFNRDHNFVNEVSELVTTNYVRKVLANTTVTEDDTNDRIVIDADDVVWTALGPPSGGPTLSAIVAFRNTGSDATSPLLSYNSYTATDVNGGDFTVQWNSAGVITATSP